MEQFVMDSRGRRKSKAWPRQIQEGHVSVTVYRRETPSGPGFRISDYTSGKRVFRDFANETEALQEATRIARRLSEGDSIAATLRKEEIASYSACIELLKPLGIPITVAVEGLVHALEKTGSISRLHEAADAWTENHRELERQPLADVVARYLELKQNQGASHRYLGDLRSRLDRFIDRVRKDCCEIRPIDIQHHLDAIQGSPVSRRNHRTILHGLFEFAVTRRFIAKNPVRDTQKVTVRATDDVAIFTPSEFRALLNAASTAFLPVLVLGGFAGLRTAELERVTWENLDLEGGYIALTAKQAKNPSRRVIPLHPAAISWLRTVPRGEGRFWLNSVPFSIHAAQKQCAEAAGVTWQKNGLRHSYASYRLAIIGDPGRVAAEMGNSPAMVHRHYKQLVKPAEAEEWFAIVPEPKS